MKILVTGSRGTVGAPLCDELRKRGHEVFGLDLQHTADPSTFRADIGHFRQVSNVIAACEPDLVYNLAAEFGRWNGEDHYEQVWQSNVVGLKHILRLQKDKRFRLVHFSSSEIYGDYPEQMQEQVPELVSIRQLNDYAISKWVNELQILNETEMHSLEVVRVRLFNTYGPGEYYHPYRSAVCRFVYSALTNQPFTVHSGHLRTNTYIGDCVSTLANIAEKFIPGRVYNIASQDAVPMEIVGKLVIKASGADPDLMKIAEPEHFTTRVKYVDANLARSELGHSDSVSLEEGISKTVEWMRETLSPRGPSS